MQINQSTNTPNFQAKFFRTKSLENVALYAVKHNAFGKLDRMQKHISSVHLKTRVRVDIKITEEGFPQVIFTRSHPKHDTLIARCKNDYKKIKSVTYTSEKKDNPLWFAMNKIIEMGKNVPNNDIFKEVIMRR